MGHQALLFNLTHLFNENVYSEFLVSYLLSPRTPYIFDAMGYTKDFLEEELLLTQPSVVFASEYLNEEKLDYLLKESKRPVFMCDLTDYTSPIYGRIIDRPILSTLNRNFGHVRLSCRTNSSINVPLLSIFTPL